MKKIRVAFFLHLTEAWLGGVNYYKNLLSIISEDEEINIEPVVFISPGYENLLKDFPKVKIIETALLKKWGLQWFFSRVICKVLKKDVALRRLLIEHQIDVVSHLQGRLFIIDIPQIAWIPDFQHKYLLELFSADEQRRRNIQFELLAQNCDMVILSSYDAEKDFIRFFPEYKEKAQVLQFVVPVGEIKYDANGLREKYKIEGSFFYLPNQFWEHKNHKVVLEALYKLKKSGLDIQVICSGNTEDNRNLQHFQLLTAYIEKYELEKNFKILGKIPYVDVQALARECKALINPSLFEGWSTTVEEAKSLGKRIILSDINVHKEQNPAGGVYFPVNDAERLAEIMLEAWTSDNTREKELTKNAHDDLVYRKNDIRNVYKTILKKVLNARVKRYD